MAERVYAEYGLSGWGCKALRLAFARHSAPEPPVRRSTRRSSLRLPTPRPRTSHSARSATRLRGSSCPTSSCGAAGSTRCGPGCGPRRRCSRPRARIPPVGRFLRVTSSVGAALALLVRQRAGDAAVARRDLAAPAPVVRTPRLDVHQARSDRLGRRGAVPRGARRGVQAPPRPGPGRVVRRRAPGRRGGPRPAARRGVRPLRRGADRGRVDRAGARGDAAHRRRGRRQGAAPAHRDARPPGPRRDGVARAAPGRADPGRRAREPARRSSSCSPRRSSRSSTSGSKPRTCSTSPRCSRTPASATPSCRGRTRSS